MNNKLKKIVIVPSEKVYNKIKAEATKQKRSVTNYISAVLSSLYKESDIVNIDKIVTIDNNIDNTDNISEDAEDRPFGE